MRFFVFFLICFSLPYCFAQTNPMEYFYKGRHEEAIPDFAALAVLERQDCPFNIRNEEQLCTSRYKIIRILNVKSDAVRKEYIEAKEKPMLPYLRHRPILIFGKHRNGHLQIEEYEEMREYFGDSECEGKNCIAKHFLLLPSRDLFGSIYAFHSIGTSYYDIKNLDSVDMLYYNEYLMPEIKHRVEVAGKNFDELLLRLTQNRTPIKAAKIKNDFVALGVIKNICDDSNNSKRTNLYELGVAIETVIKNDAKINPNTAIIIDRARLPLGWGCQPLDYYLKERIPFYFFGNLRDGYLVIDSLVSPLDAFVFADTIYDISMGFPFEELVSYFLPSNISLEEFKFGRRWYYLNFTEIRDSKRAGKISEPLASMSECLRNDIIEIATKTSDYWDNYRRRPKEKSEFDWLFSLPILLSEDLFRCRMYYKSKQGICRGYDSSGKGVWGCK